MNLSCERDLPRRFAPVLGSHGRGGARRRGFRGARGARRRGFRGARGARLRARRGRRRSPLHRWRVRNRSSSSATPEGSIGLQDRHGGSPCSDQIENLIAAQAGSGATSLAALGRGQGGPALPAGFRRDPRAGHRGHRGGDSRQRAQQRPWPRLRRPPFRDPGAREPHAGRGGHLRPASGRFRRRREPRAGPRSARARNHHPRGLRFLRHLAHHDRLGTERTTGRNLRGRGLRGRRWTRSGEELEQGSSHRTGVDRSSTGFQPPALRVIICGTILLGRCGPTR